MEIEKSSRMLSIAIICVKISTCCPLCFQLPKQDSQSSQLAWLWVTTWGFCRWHSQSETAPAHRCGQGWVFNTWIINICTISAPPDWTAGVAFHQPMGKEDLLHTNMEEQQLQLGTHTGLYETNQNFVILIFNCLGHWLLKTSNIFKEAQSTWIKAIESKSGHVVLGWHKVSEKKWRGNYHYP